MNSDFTEIYIRLKNNCPIETGTILSLCCKRARHKCNSLLLIVAVVSGHHMLYFSYTVTSPSVFFLSLPPYESPFLGSKLLHCQHVQAASGWWQAMKSGLLTSIQIDVL